MVRMLPLSGPRAGRLASRTPPERPLPPPRLPTDTFEAPRAPGFSPIAPTPLPQTSPADARTRAAITETLAQQFNQPFSVGPGVPRNLAERFRPGFEAGQAAGRAELEVARQDPSGAALVLLAVKQVRSHIDSAGVQNRLFGQAFTRQTREVLAAITPEAVARDGLAQTFNNAVAELKRIGLSIDPRIAAQLTPHPLELAIRGG
ncbi:MAG: hypothetical protein SFW67_25790 [Myxococcaceae bacterium]|nr:hypothetical protein [Myxococcaceae bacterium]